ncbi:MAG: hypothetical protein KC636_31795 [Myxococcales bacterium]|nr:hypothetical protein [Myxococcales bacterium]
MTTVGPTEPTTETETETETDPTTTPPPVCGNGIPEVGEECDDGNEIPQDGCEDDCTLTPGMDFWTRLYDHDGKVDEGMGVALDGQGNIYVVATVEDDSNGEDIWIRKYDTTGVSQWTQQYDGGIGSTDGVAAVTSDAQGFMIAIGRQAIVPNAGSEFWMSRCDPTGVVIWQFTETANIAGSDVTMATDGDFVVVGSIKQNNDDNLMVRRYDSSGSEQWTRVYEGPDNGPDAGGAVAVDGAGNIIVVGRTFTMAEGFNVIIRQHAPDGAPGWSIELDAGGTDWATGVAIDGPAGEFVVVGRADGPGSVDAWIGRYTLAGDELWTTLRDGPAGDVDLAHDVAVAPGGDFVVVGQEYVEGQEDNLWIARYTSAGDEVWSEAIDGESEDVDIARAVAIDPQGSIVTVGTVTNIANFDTDVWINKRAP